jgi:3-phytase
MRRAILLVTVVATTLLLATPAAPAPPGTILVPSTLETVPTGRAGDTADDAAIWVNTNNPSASLVVTNEKLTNRMTVLNLDGQVVQRITASTFFGNLDFRGDILAVAHSGIWTYRMTQTTNGPRLVLARESSGNAGTSGEGLCMWDPGAPGIAGGLYAININRNTFRVRVHPLTDGDGDGLLQVGAAVRAWFLAGEGEGCVVDDTTGALYLAEEDVAIWRYNLTAPGSAAPPRTTFRALGADLTADIEGLALADGQVYASSQNLVAPSANWFSRYDRPPAPIEGASG